MELGIIGLGRMGSNMARRLLKFGHTPVVFDLNTTALEEAKGFGAKPTTTLADLVKALTPPRAVWVMVPAGKPTQNTINQLFEILAPGDIVIDGGNSHYKEDIEHSTRGAERGIHFLDIGTSGGIWGLENGYCLMIGGPRPAFERVEPVLKALAPENGYAYMGASGSGHFVKMVHNGIEYGFLQALGEGFELMEKAGYNLDLHAIASLWQQGSVVRCWLLDLAKDALAKDPQLAGLKGVVADSGEGRWTVEAAIEKAVSLPAITSALFARFASRDEDAYSNRFIAALRNEFGGHAVEKAK